MYIHLPDEVAQALSEDVRSYLQDKPILYYERMSYTLWEVARQVDEGGTKPKSWKGPVALAVGLIIFWWLFWFLLTR